MKGSDLFIKALENEGVEFIFGLAGEENIDFLKSLIGSSIKYIPVRHEQSAGFMAATYGRLTGKPGVVLTTLGPGATNLVTAAAYAKLGGMPMIMITGQKPIGYRNQGHFQIIDTVALMKPITQSSEQVKDANSIPSIVRQAFKTAEMERPGPVHIELPIDIAKQESSAKIIPANKIRRPIAEEKAIKQAVEKIESAKHPLILIGAGANRKLTAKMLKEFIEKTGIPFFNTQMGKGVIDESHDLYIGTAALSSNDYVHCAIEKSDLIINIGHDVIEKPPFLMNKINAEVIHINFYPAIVDQVYHPQIEVIGDIANSIWQIKEAINVKKSWDFAYYKIIKTELEKQISLKIAVDTDPIIPQRLIHEVRESMPDDGILALDNGMYKLWFARNYKAYSPNSILLDNALATMGAGLPSAIAAKLVNPDKQVVAVVGDGGFMMNSQELETAVRLNLDITILLIRDNGLGMIEWKWEQEVKEKSIGLTHNNPDFVKYAESYGAIGYTVSKSDDFMTKFKEALKTKGVKLLDVEIDYSENKKFFTEELNNKTCPNPNQ